LGLCSIRATFEIQRRFERSDDGTTADVTEDHQDIKLARHREMGWILDVFLVIGQEDFGYLGRSHIVYTGDHGGNYWKSGGRGTLWA